MALITQHVTVIAIEDMSVCPNGFNPDTYEQTYNSYVSIMTRHLCTPAIEYIFERVEACVLNDIVKEIVCQLSEDEGYKRFTEHELSELSSIAAKNTLDENMKQQIYGEIVRVLNHLGLAYRSESNEPGRIFNTPQISLMEERGLYRDNSAYVSRRYEQRPLSF